MLKAQHSSGDKVAKGCIAQAMSVAQPRTVEAETLEDLVSSQIPANNKSRVPSGEVQPIKA